MYVLVIFIALIMYVDVYNVHTYIIIHTHPLAGEKTIEHMFVLLVSFMRVFVFVFAFGFFVLLLLLFSGEVCLDKMPVNQERD